MKLKTRQTQEQQSQHGRVHADGGRAAVETRGPVQVMTAHASPLEALPTGLKIALAVGLAVFVAGVGWSRVHLGVHYPSDILAGWALATAWAVACRLAVFFPGDRPG